MKTLKISLMTLAMLFGTLGVACEHCDDEDYRRDEIEKNTSTQIHRDTTDIFVGR